MGYAKKLQQRYDGLNALRGGELQKRRDKLNGAGVHRGKQSATFSTNVKGTEKRKGSSKIPMGYPSCNSQFKGR